MAKKIDIQSRIVAHTYEEPEQLLANPWNFRRHGEAQRAALLGTLRTIGWVRSVLANRTTQHVIDGHMRIEEALKAHTKVPVEWCEVSVEEERVLLAEMDPMSAMAAEDEEQRTALLQNIAEDDTPASRDPGVRALLLDMEGEESEPVEVKELAVSDLTEERFWMSVRGPAPKQLEALERLKAALTELPGVEVDVGWTEGA